MAQQPGGYYVPGPSLWPLVGSLGLFITVIGVADWLQQGAWGSYALITGSFILVVMMIGWFGAVIRESEAGLYNAQVDLTYRWSMGWFIFSEVCFFAMFFATLLYSRYLTIPGLGGDDPPLFLTHLLLWPDFIPAWPLLHHPDPEHIIGAHGTIHTWGLPALNTLILLLSGVTITWAHHALKERHRQQLHLGMGLTIVLGLVFLYCQAHEYGEAYRDLNLTLESGIYGATFYLLTGFHGIHVTLGTVMLMVILGRCLCGHFTPERHFAFEAVAWYWHFVDVVWLLLFILVYWM